MSDIAEREQWARKNLDHAITFAVEGLKSLLLLNGGSAIALLTLIGALTVHPEAAVRLSLDAIKAAIVYFGSGVGAVAMAFVFAYFAQIAFMHHCQTSKTWQAVVANVCRIVGTLLMFSSATFFYLGASNALEGIRPSPTRPNSN